MPRRSFRRAIATSVLIHAALVAVLVVGWNQKPPQRPPALDTQVDGEVRLALLFEEERAVEVSVAPTPIDKSEETGGLRPPLAQATPIPRTLPPELLALLKRPTPVGGEVVDVAVTPTTLRPASATIKPAPEPNPGVHTPGSPQTRPIHGALPAAKTIVYVLDASGSMGEWGKLAKARLALVATLRQQPPTVRFQVVVYNGTARALVPDPSGGCVTASAENLSIAEEKLKGVEPVGRSDHAAGLRAAMHLRPDFVLILTDADDLSAAKLRGVVAQAAKPAVVCVAKVGAEGVGAVREVK